MVKSQGRGQMCNISSISGDFHRFLRRTDSQWHRRPKNLCPPYDNHANRNMPIFFAFILLPRESLRNSLAGLAALRKPCKFGGKNPNGLDRA
jgi:hypothetical protein